MTKYSFVDIRFNREIINYAVLRNRRFIILKDTGEYVYDYLSSIARTTILLIVRLETTISRRGKRLTAPLNARLRVKRCTELDDNTIKT